MSAFTKAARIVIPVFIAAATVTVAAVTVQRPARADDAVDAILMGYATVLIRNGVAGDATIR